MIRSWFIFWAEFIGFSLALLLAGYLYLRPHLEQGFVSILEARFGLEVEVDQVFFSPLGKVVGKGLVLAGGDAGESFRIDIEEFRLDSEENVYLTLWERQENFDWKDLHYAISLTDLRIEGPNQGLVGSIDEVVGHAGGQELDVSVRGPQLSGDWGEASMEALTLSGKDRRFHLQLDRFEARGEGWEAKGEGGRTTVDASGAWPPRRVEDWIEALEDSRWSDLSARWQDRVIDLRALRFLRFEEKVWKLSVQGDVLGHPGEHELTLRRNEGDRWSLEGAFLKASPWGPLQLSVGGPLNERGPWAFEGADGRQNSLSGVLTHEDGNQWVGTWSLLARSVAIPESNFPAIEGRGTGGFAWLADAKALEFTAKVDGLGGGPAFLDDATVRLKGRLLWEERLLMVEDATLVEAEAWGGKLSSRISLSPLLPESLSLNFHDFPLGRFSKKTGGVLQGNIQYGGNELDALLESDIILPDKDPLKGMEKFSVRLKGKGEELSFLQSFVMRGEDRSFEVGFRAPGFLEDPTRVHRGTLTTFRAQVGLYDLKLEEEEPIRVDLQGIQLPHFRIADANERLRWIEGQAFIPFINPRRLMLEARGEMDLSKMPPIGRNELKGRVHIDHAKWDTGWGLRNLRATLRGEGVEIQPESIFDPLKVQVLRGRLANSTIHIEEALAKVGEAGQAKLEATYVLPQPHLKLKGSAIGLDFHHSDYHLKYDLKNLLVTGSPQKLEIRSDLEVDRFLYSGDFNMMGEDGRWRQPLRIQPPESLDIQHTLNLKVKNRHPLLIDNNSLGVSFDVDELSIHGPLSKLKWKGRLLSRSAADHRLLLPFQWLDVSFRANTLELTFDDEDRWDPLVHLEAETEVDGVRINLQYDHRVSELGQGRFRLNSSPGYSRTEILSILSSGEKPSSDIFDTPTPNEESEEAGPSLTLFRSDSKRGQDSPLRYRAGLGSGDDPFEFRAQYRLSEHLSLEVSQATERQTFAGVRLTRQSESFPELFQTEDLFDKTDTDTGHDVIWKAEGLPFGSSMKGALLSDLTRANGALMRGDHAGAKTLIRETVEPFLARHGFLDGTYSIREIRQEVRPLVRRGGQRTRTRERSTVVLSFEPGDRYVLHRVKVEGWPEDLEFPEDRWLNQGRLRSPYLDRSRMEEFRVVLLNRLADRGYPKAKLLSMELTPHHPDPPESLSKTLKPLMKVDHPEQRWMGSRPLNLSIAFDSGEIHRVVQVQSFGAKAIQEQPLMELLGQPVGRVYSEARVITYPGTLESWYEANGYFGTQVTLSKVLHSRRYPRISIHLQVSEGERWELGEVRLKGLKYSDEAYLLMVLGLKENAPIKPQILAEAIERLGRLSQLRSVQYEWKERDGEGRRDLEINVEEQPSWSLSLRAGYRSGEGAEVSTRMARQNLRGRGEILNLENHVSQDEQRHTLRYEVPEILGGEWKGQVLMGMGEEVIQAQDIDNETWLTGVSVSKDQEQYRRVFDFFYREDLNIDGRFRSLRARSLLRNDAVALPKQPGRGLGWSAFNQLIAYLERRRFAYIGDYRTHYGMKLGGSMLVPWLRVAHKWSLGKEFDLPVADRFYLGGTGSLRGFVEGEVTGETRRGGESLSAFGVELFYPVRDRIDGSLFYEWGRVYDSSSFRMAGEPGHALGMGLLFRTPVGPIEGYFAHPIGEDSFGRVGLQLGTIF